MAAEMRSFSRTALGVAAHRAVHQHRDGEPRILDDPISGRLLDPGALERLLSAGGAEEAATAAMRRHVVRRGRYAEDRLALAVERGVGQCVILGAGLDTFAYRQPSWAAGLRLFEVDHPASQTEKRRRLVAAGVAVPDNLRFTAIDFEITSLREGLEDGGVEFEKPTFFSCLGVLVYLTKQAARGVFELVACFPPGSEIAFSYSAPQPSPSRAARRAGEVGEPWLTQFERPALTHDLTTLGFSSISFLEPTASHGAASATARGGVCAAIVGGPSGV